MIRKIGMTWRWLITVTLFVTMLSTFSWVGTAAAQTAGNAQTGTNSAPQVIHYSSKQALSDGGTNFVFNINGVQNVLHEAPNGFSPATATDAQLAEYGFPARPKDAAGLAKWTSRWSNFKYQSVSDPVLTLMPSTESANTISPASGPIAQINHPTWCGYGDYNGSTKFTEAGGSYYQPTYGANSPSGAEEDTWVGLGGYFDTPTLPLLQVGSEMDGSSTYYSWYEYSTASTKNRIVYSGAVNADDDISVVVSWTASSNYPADFSFFDFNTGTHFNIDVAISSAYYDGSSAEFIDGRPSSSVPLANFGSNQWYSPNANNTSFDSWSYVNFTMYNSSDGDTLAFPTLSSIAHNFINNFEQSS